MFNAWYYVQQGLSLISVYSQARDIKTLLSGQEIDPKERDFLLLTQEIRSFAQKDLGLKSNRNYTRYARIKADHLADIVSACDDLSFKQYTWNYPLFGALPYKGFFKLENARELALELKKQNLDVYVRPVDAFSTLGWFSDPLFSYMADYSEFQIAQLLIHEQTHASLFLKGQGDFNENLATVVGRFGALEWLEVRYGKESPVYTKAQALESDSSNFRLALHKLYEQLEAVYEKTELSREDRLALKEKTLKDFAASWSKDWAPRFVNEGYKNFNPEHINNAYLATFKNYNSDQSVFETLLEQYGGSIPELMSHLQKIPSNAKPFDYVNSLVKR